MAAQATGHPGLRRERRGALGGLALIGAGAALLAAMLRLGRVSPLALLAIGVVAVGVLMMVGGGRWRCAGCGVPA